MQTASISAEQALLGAVLLDPAGQHQVLNLVQPGDMVRPWHAQVLAAMQRVRGRGALPSPAEVYAELQNDPDLPSSVSRDAVRVAGLMEAAPRARHAPAYAVMVIEGGIRQRLHLAGSRLAQASETGNLEVVLRQAASCTHDLNACRARWLALPGHLRPELPAPAGQAGDDARVVRRKAAVREELARREDPKALAAGEQALRDLAAAPSQLAHVARWLQPGHFARPESGELYAVMRDMNAAGRPVDPVTITWEAARRGLPADPRSLAGGTGLFAVASAREVYRHGVLAQAAQAGQDMQAEATDPSCSPRRLMQSAGERLRALEPQQQSGLRPARDAKTPAQGNAAAGEQVRYPEREAAR
jgi:replicative DNA helicase